jgi:hypothetical protein
MTERSHPTQLLDRAEIEQAIEQAKVVRAETFLACFRDFIDLVRTLPGATFSGVATLKSSSEWKGSSHINAS